MPKVSKAGLHLFESVGSITAPALTGSCGRRAFESQTLRLRIVYGTQLMQFPACTVCWIGRAAWAVFCRESRHSRQSGATPSINQDSDFRNALVKFLV